MSKKHKSKKPIKKPNNFAYIDGANLDKGLKDLGWRLDYQRFRVWLKDKYSVSRAYIFIGLIPKYKDLYTYLQKSGFTLIFKEVVYDSNGKTKGNCDADLVLQATRDVYNQSLEKKCSILLKRTNTSITYLDTQKSILEVKKKAPNRY